MGHRQRPAESPQPRHPAGLNPRPAQLHAESTERNRTQGAELEEVRT